MSETGGITPRNTPEPSGNLPSSTGSDFTVRLENFVTEMRGRLNSTKTPTTPSQTVPYSPSDETPLPQTPASETETETETTQTVPYTPSDSTTLPETSETETKQPTEDIPTPSSKETKAPVKETSTPVPEKTAASDKPSETETPSQNQPTSENQTPTSTQPQEREFYTDVVDANKNNVFDQEDVAGVVYDKEVISSELSTRPERLILMGEDHQDQPLDTIEATIKKIAATGKPVIYTIELSSEYLSANGPDLIERLNNGEITPQEFESRFVRHLQQTYGSNIAIDPKEVASTIVRMHNAGAKIVPIDDGSKEVLDYSEANNIDDVSQIKGINRDEIMANNLIDLYKENPDATIIASLGGAHAQTKAGVQNNFGSSDSKHPVGTRLIEAVGRDQVFSVYNYQTSDTKDYKYYDILADGYLNGNFGQEVAYDTWDMYVPANDS